MFAVVYTFIVCVCVCVCVCFFFPMIYRRIICVQGLKKSYAAPCNNYQLSVITFFLFKKFSMLPMSSCQKAAYQKALLGTIHCLNEIITTVAGYLLFFFLQSKKLACVNVPAGCDNCLIDWYRISSYISYFWLSFLV